MKMIFSLMLMMISMFMLFINNPMSMGLLILMQTLLVCMLSGMMIKTYWFSYILFLTFLGGLLVLFIYVSSIASNQLFYMKFNYKKTLILLTILMLLMMLMLNNKMTWMNLSMNSDMNMFNNMIFFFNNENKINLSKLYNNQTFLIMMMLVIYLFITLIAIVKITNIFHGPLRSSNY
uniref:NADH-ubiquinone oxidoreductase chain 6 n=1 Tax=Spodoptera exempta TaxID=134406 RepID=A0A872ZQA2_9NEOP|nr:NADH dehydrogenase subunit 6 [Spodoptera exempta]QOY46709.1 NADH dehydrogenase subunit 6 [Spodoptera exempta]